MLTPIEQVRLRNAIPSSYTAEWDVDDNGTVEEFTYNHEIWWEDEDHNQNWPVLLLGWNARGVQKEDESPMNQVLNVDEQHSNANTKELEVGDRMYDELTVQAVVSGELSNDGVPAKVRANSFAQEIWRFFRFSFDQNSQGPNGERPVLARVVDSPTLVTKNVDEEDTERYQFAVRLHYTSSDTAEVDTVETISGDIDLDGDADTVEDFTDT